MNKLDSNNNITIRAAAAEDLNVIMELLRPFMKEQQLLSRSREDVAQLLPSGFVALAAEAIVGFATIEIYSNKLAEIQCLAVCESCQGRGIGKFLIAACIEVAKQQSVLEVMAISASDQFLKQCGFDYSLPGRKRALFYNTQT